MRSLSKRFLKMKNFLKILQIGDEWETINLNESDRKNYRNKK